MATQIATSTNSDATATPSAQQVAVAPSDASINAQFFGNNGPALATAQSPYSSWSTQGIGASTTRNAQALLAHTADDNLEIGVTSPGNGPYYFTGARSGNVWNLSAIGPIDGTYEASNSGNSAAYWMGKDQQGRTWALGVDDVNATYQVWCDYYSGGSWASGGAAIEGLNLGEQNRRGVAAAIIGNYLVVVFDAGAGALKYQRIDVHGVSLGSWSAAAAISGISDVTTSSVLALAAIPGGTTGMLAYSGGNGISALSYDASSDTWSASHSLSSAANDRHPTLVAGASGVVYAVWCQYAAANSYALVGEAYSSGAWSGSVSTLEAAGSNIAWPSGGYLSSGPKLALIWTQGTASPYSVEFDNPAAPATGSSIQLSGTLASTLSISGTLTVTKALAATLASTLALSGTLTVGSPAATAPSGVSVALSLGGPNGVSVAVVE